MLLYSIFLIGGNCFIMLCWFLPFSNMNQLYVYICPLPSELSSHLPPHPTPLGCYRALDLSSLHHTANFHGLSNFICGNVYISMLLLLLLSHFSRVQLCATPEMAAHQAPPSLGFSRQDLEWVAIAFSNA